MNFYRFGKGGSPGVRPLQPIDFTKQIKGKDYGHILKSNIRLEIGDAQKDKGERIKVKGGRTEAARLGR